MKNFSSLEEEKKRKRENHPIPLLNKKLPDRKIFLYVSGMRGIFIPFSEERKHRPFHFVKILSSGKRTCFFSQAIDENVSFPFRSEKNLISSPSRKEKPQPFFKLKKIIPFIS